LKYELKNRQVLCIRCKDKEAFGGDQSWYEEIWHQNAGCGPTTASNLVWYLASTRPGLGKLCTYDGSCQEGFLALMDDVWEYVTPGNYGLNKPEMLYDGVVRYGADRGIPFTWKLFAIPRQQCRRSSLQEMKDFVTGALSRDVPVAFLNLSNGKLNNLDSWHWVTLSSYDPDTGMGEISDQGGSKEIDLTLWYETTIMGGAMVTIDCGETEGKSDDGSR